MHLYFVRHGLASWPAWAGADAERPLNADGQRQIEALGPGLARRLASSGRKPNLILHSPLVRARQTAEIIASHLALTDCVEAQTLLEPGFDLPALKKLLKHYPDAKALLLVGHNPDMAEAVTALTEKPVRFKEGTVAHVTFKRSEPDHAALVWLATAEELASEA
jgi:phosphohistidine phosphatase